MDINDCLEKGYLVKEAPAPDLTKKELKESDYDLEKAKKALSDKDYKWAIVKSYYSAFHAAKAVCFKLGYREKKHFAVLIVLENLNKMGKLEIKFVNNFAAALNAREGADYKYAYSVEKAEYILGMAEEFNKHMKKLVDELA